MQYNCDVIFVIAISSSIFTLSSASHNLKQYLEKKCVDQEAHLLDKNLHHLSSQFEKSFAFIPDNLGHFCTEEVTSLKYLARNSSEVFRHCVSGEEGYLPNFLEIGFYGFLDFLCSHYGQSIRQLYSEEGSHCLNQLQSPTASIDADRCFEEFTPPTHYLTKHKLCHDISRMKHCFDGVLSKYCPANRVMPELNAQLYHSLTAPCRIRESPVSTPGSAGLIKSEVYCILSMLLLILTKSIASF